MLKFFKKIEAAFRRYLSHKPLLYALVGGVGVVLFWRGVWHSADAYGVGNIASMLLGILFLLPTGLLVSVFIGDHVIISGLKGEKKITEETEKEIKREESLLGEEHWETEEILRRLDRIEHQLEEEGKEKNKK